MKLWRLALRNLRRNRRRNAATGVAVALGYAGIVLFGGYIARVETFLRVSTVYLQHTAHVSIYHQGGLERSLARPSHYSLSSGEQQRVLEAAAGDPRIAFAARYLRGMGLAGNGCRTVPFQAIGVELPVFARILRHPDVTGASPEFARPVRGAPLPDAATVPGAVGLSVGLARLLGKTKVHEEVSGHTGPLVIDCAGPDAAAEIASDANIQLAGMTFDGSLTAIDGEMVNTFHTPSMETEDQTILAPLETLQRLYATDAVTYVGLFLHDHREAGAVARDMAERLRGADVAADVYTFEDNRVNPYYVGSMAFLGSLLAFVGSLVTAVVVLGILNSVTLTVYERTREIGTLRALGWRRRQIAALFLREGLVLAAAGIGVGALIAWIVSSGVNAADIRFSPPGIPGQVQLLLWPGPRVFLTVAGILVPLLASVTWGVARRRARERTSDLLTATTA
jgi:putative ABC transport system permease protein